MIFLAVGLHAPKRVLAFSPLKIEKTEGILGASPDKGTHFTIPSLFRFNRESAMALPSGQKLITSE
jgi:hypothetical protein